MALCFTFGPSILSAQRINLIELGEFDVVPRIDPITDRDETIIFLRPNDDAPVSLVMDCRGTALWMHLLSDVELLGEESPLLIYRFDQDPPDTTIVLRAGERSSSGKHFYLVPREDQNRIASRIRSARRLVFRVRSASDRLPLDLFYALAQSSQAMSHLRCSSALTPRESSDPDVVARLDVESVLVDELRVEDDAAAAGDIAPTADWRLAEKGASSYVAVIEGGGAYYPLTCDMGKMLLAQAKQGVRNLFYSSAQLAERSGYNRAPSCR